MENGPKNLEWTQRRSKAEYSQQKSLTLKNRVSELQIPSSTKVKNVFSYILFYIIFLKNPPNVLLHKDFNKLDI